MLAGDGKILRSREDGQGNAMSCFKNFEQARLAANSKVGCCHTKEEILVDGGWKLKREVLGCVQKEQITASFMGMVWNAAKVAGADFLEECFRLEGILGEDVDAGSVDEDELGEGVVS